MAVISQRVHCCFVFFKSMNLFKKKNLASIECCMNLLAVMGLDVFTFS